MENENSVPVGLCPRKNVYLNSKTLAQWIAGLSLTNASLYGSPEWDEIPRPDDYVYRAKILKAIRRNAKIRLLRNLLIFLSVIAYYYVAIRYVPNLWEYLMKAFQIFPDPLHYFIVNCSILGLPWIILVIWAAISLYHCKHQNPSDPNSR